MKAEKQNKILIVVAIVLALLVAALIGYIVYDNFLVKENEPETEEPNPDLGEHKPDYDKYLGVWYAEGDQSYTLDDITDDSVTVYERELTISKIDEKEVTFSLEFYRYAALDDVTAHFNGDTATFTSEISGPDGTVKGTVKLAESKIIITITDSDVEGILKEEIIFANKK